MKNELIFGNEPYLLHAYRAEAVKGIVMPEFNLMETEQFRLRTAGIEIQFRCRKVSDLNNFRHSLPPSSFSLPSMKNAYISRMFFLWDPFCD